MRRLLLIGSISLIGAMTITGCNGQPRTAPSNDMGAAVPGSAAPAGTVSRESVSATPVPDRTAPPSQGVLATIPDVPVAVQVVAESGKYVMRTNADDKPLYTYDQDTPGKSNCDDSCAKAWPPLVAPADAKPVGSWTVVTRADGSHQWALGGKPVYTFAHDAEAVASGDGTGGVWHLLPTISAK